MHSYTYDELFVGQTESFTAAITEDMMDAFFRLTGDENPLHRNADYVQAAGFPGRVVYGMLTASLLSTLAGVYLPGLNSLIHSVDIRFTKPVYIGDRLEVTGTIADKIDLSRAVRMSVSIRNQDDVRVLRGTMQIGVRA